MARRPGAPSKILDNATPDQTIVDVLVTKIALGLGQRTACDLAGISRGALHKWTITGSRLTAQQAQGKLPNPTDEQLALIEFVSRMKEAYAEGEDRRLGVIDRAASGGHTVTRTTTRVANGKIEETTVVEELAPQWTAAAWWLERTMPAKYARRVEVTGAGGEPLVPPSEQAATLAASLRAYQQGLEDAEQTETADG